MGGLGGEQIIKLSLDALRERGQLLAVGHKSSVSIGAERPTGDLSSLVNPTVLLTKFGGSEGGADGRAC